MKTLFVFSSLGSYIVPALLLIGVILFFLFLRDWKKYIAHLRRTSPIPGFANALIRYLSAEEARRACQRKIFPWKLIFLPGYNFMVNDCQKYAEWQLEKIKNFIGNEYSFDAQWAIVAEQYSAHLNEFSREVIDLPFPNLFRRKAWGDCTGVLRTLVQQKISDLLSKHALLILRAKRHLAYLSFSAFLKEYYDIYVPRSENQNKYNYGSFNNFFNSLVSELVKKNEKEITDHAMNEIKSLQIEKDLNERMNKLEAIQSSFVFREFDSFFGFGAEDSPRYLLQRKLSTQLDEVYFLKAKESTGKTREQYLEKIKNKGKRNEFIKVIL